MRIDTVIDTLLQVDWVAGDEIIITSSGLSAWEGEKRKITSVSADNMTLTLNETLKFNHGGKFVWL